MQTFNSYDNGISSCYATLESEFSDDGFIKGFFIEYNDYSTCEYKKDWTYTAVTLDKDGEFLSFTGPDGEEWKMYEYS
jgi:hypothetical protein